MTMLCNLYSAAIIFRVKNLMFINNNSMYDTIFVVSVQSIDFLILFELNWLFFEIVNIVGLFLRC